VSGAITALNEAITALGEVITAPGGAITALGEAITATGGAITALGEAITALGEAITAPGGAIAALGGAITALGGAITALGGAITAHPYKTWRKKARLRFGKSMQVPSLSQMRRSLSQRAPGFWDGSRKLAGRFTLRVGPVCWGRRLPIMFERMTLLRLLVMFWGSPAAPKQGPLSGPENGHDEMQRTVCAPGADPKQGPKNGTRNQAIIWPQNWPHSMCGRVVVLCLGLSVHGCARQNCVYPLSP